MDSNPLEYQANIARYKEVFYYWFWSNLATGSYLMICLVALGGFALRLAFDRVSHGETVGRYGALPSCARSWKS